MEARVEGNWAKVVRRRVGGITGTGTGGLQSLEDSCRALFEKGPSRVSPFFVPMYMPNVAAALLSMRYGVKGPNYCTVSACASSAHSVADAVVLIRRSEEHTSELQSQSNLVCRLLLEKKKHNYSHDLYENLEQQIVEFTVLSVSNQHAMVDQPDPVRSELRPYKLLLTSRHIVTSLPII